jgi:S1-C subfamily serine protease
VRGALIAGAAVLALVGFAPMATASTGTHGTIVITVEPGDTLRELGGGADGVEVPPVHGGASLFSGIPATLRELTVIAHVAARMPVALSLPTSDPRLAQLTGGWTAEELRERECAGVCVVDGLNAAVAAAGGPGDLAVWADGDGRLVMDRRVYDALRAGAIDEAARRALFDHELTHTAYPEAEERHVHRWAPLPNLGPLADVVGVAVSPNAPFVAVADASGPLKGEERPAWQAPEIGARPHPMLARLAHVSPDADPEASGSGVIYSVDGTTGYVVTNRHVVDPSYRPGYTGGDGRGPGGEQVNVTIAAGTFRGTVLPRPADAAIVAELAAEYGAGLNREALLAAAWKLDLAIIRIDDARLADSPLAPLTFANPRPRAAVVVLGYPSTKIPTPSGELATRGLHATVTGGLVTRIEPGTATFNGNPWSVYGNSGGPLVPAGDGPPVVNGLMFGGARRRSDRYAVEGGTVAAFVRASGLIAPSRGSSRGAE